MNTAIRANRILAALENYQKAEHVGKWPWELPIEYLGDPIGCYRNPGAFGVVIGVFAEGMVWHDNVRAINIRFDDIVEVSLPNDKESEGLMLKLSNNRQLQLPVKGRRGKFFDSLEMLRFIDRVRQDRCSKLSQDTSK